MLKLVEVLIAVSGLPVEDSFFTFVFCDCETLSSAHTWDGFGLVWALRFQGQVDGIHPRGV